MILHRRSFSDGDADVEMPILCLGLAGAGGGSLPEVWMPGPADTGRLGGTEDVKDLPNRKDN